MKKIFLLDVYNNSEKRKGEIYGAQKSMEQLYKTLVRKNTCVHLFFDSEIKQDLFYNDKIILKINSSLNQFGGKILNYNIFEKINFLIHYLFFQIKIIKLLKKEKPDIFYLNDTRSFFMVFLAIKILNIKTITYIRSDLKNNFVNRLCIRFSKKIILISDNLLNDLNKNFIQKYSNKIKIIHTGFDFESYNYNEKFLTLKNQNKIRVRCLY